MNGIKGFKSVVVLFLLVVLFTILIKFKRRENIFPKYFSTKRQTVLDKMNNFSIANYLLPPHMYHTVKNMDQKYSQVGQDQMVYNILQMKGGFFIEMGAYNGVLFSNTLWLERKHNWTGLLVEANPGLCQKIDSVKRAAWRLCACISNQTNISFLSGDTLGGERNALQKDIGNRLRNNAVINVPCFTLLNVLNEIRRFSIEFFSLDIEGGELNFLNQIKNVLISKRIIVTIWSIEYRIFDGRRIVVPESKAKLNEIRAYFKDVGGYIEYCQLGSRNKEDGYALDVLFVKQETLCQKKLYKLPNGKSVDCK